MRFASPRLVLLGLTVMAASCAPRAERASTTPLPTPSANHAVISEVQAGARGDNNQEFIELYNPLLTAVDLKGWRLAYRLPSSTDDLLVFAWERSTVVPAHGHYLLVRLGEEVGTSPDATFTQALNTSNGALALMAPDGGVVDAVGWGEGASGMTEGRPAPALDNGQSLERRPGNDLGNGLDTQDNQADFTISSSPDPQDTGSPASPALPLALKLNVSAPSSVEPGAQFRLELAVANTSDLLVPSISVTAWVPETLAVAAMPAGVSIDAGRLIWTIDQLDSGGSQSISLILKAPWTRGNFALLNPMVTSSTLARAAFASPAWITVQDGPIPIGVARSLLNQSVTVEGVATITTGALFAGAGNAKFYMSDSTGGVQIWVPGGEFDLDIPLGAKVRVHGMPQDYRGTVELVADSSDSVEVMAQDAAPSALEATISQTQQSPGDLAGKLIRVEGQLTQAVDETYSYNLTLDNPQGETLNVYVDKQTQLQVEGLAIDQPYAISGILETPDGIPTLYPRLASDFEQAYPKALLVTLNVPASAPPSSPFEISATVSNHTGQDVHSMRVTTTLPTSSEIIEIGPGGALDGAKLTWQVGDLASGEAQEVTYRARTSLSGGELDVPSFRAETRETTAASTDGRVFVGTTVPIWAIQGDGQRSPYVLQTLSTQGVVTGVFPGLTGFWIQSTRPDDDPGTSDAIFVNAGVLRVDVAQGDLVAVSGKVRELSEQTQLELSSVSDVEVIRRGLKLPTPVALDPPPDDEAALIYNEAHEGMLVAVQEPAVAIGPTSIYGEYTLVLAKYGVDRIMRGQPAGRRIVVDDGANTVHDTSEGLPYLVAVGDRIQGLVGPLAYTFGQHKIEPLATPRVTHSSLAAPSLPPTPEGEFRLMTWNAENLFDALPPHPSDPPPPTPAEYQRNLQKVAATIRAAGEPSVVALQEVENIDILNDLAAMAELAPYHYSAYLMEGTDSRGIDVGYLVRSDRAVVSQEKQLPVPEGLLSRPPLELTVEPLGVEGLPSITLFNNHFTALSGGIDITRPRRVEQAGLNAEAVKALLSDSPTAPVAVVGDLNSFYGSPPLQTLISAGLMDLFDGLAPDQRYSYIYQGVAQTLDHILVSQGLGTCLTDYTVLHLDSPYPPPAPDDSTATRKSDHDPLVASFRCFH